jgi:hypothetical protein
MPIPGNRFEVHFFRVALASDRIPGPLRLELPVDPGEGPDLDLLPGVFGEEETWSRQELADLTLEVVKSFTAVRVAVSVHAEYEQIGCREIGDHRQDVVDSPDRIEATHSR